MWPVSMSPSMKTAMISAAEFAGKSSHFLNILWFVTWLSVKALRGIRSTGTRSTWPSQRNLCSVISSSIGVVLFLPNTIRRVSLLSTALKQANENIFVEENQFIHSFSPPYVWNSIRHVTQCSHHHHRENDISVQHRCFTAVQT
ncbi:hypothetical protein T265_07240 [Opisthorchis viverrini]|uniref:Uncharacterized protein n=1 Tax=Opisthorchis viverrini TaxID=6198 RepID=A0A075AC38_OPIVI|nr:hypothetical protein T265_07240 [Opisthorchis viverrini]KER25254.1 hypothetical protein T265_07240 [Opisthorchis viverrini]